MLIYVPTLTEVDNHGKETVSSFDRALACAYIQLNNERKKGKVFSFSQTGEKITFFVQILWPFILVESTPGKRVVFDAVGFMKQNVYDGEITKTDKFTSQVEKCSPTLMSRPDFHENLERFASYFKDFDKEKIHEIAGCFSERQKAKDIVNSLRLSGLRETNEAICLPITVNSKEAKTAISLLSELRKKEEADIKALNEKLQPLDSTLPKWLRQIEDQINGERYPYDAKIKEITPYIRQTIRQIEENKKNELAPLELIISQIKSEIRQLQEFENIHKANERRAEENAMNAARAFDQATEDVNEAEEELNIERRQTYEDSCDESARQASISRLETRISYANDKLSRVYRAYEDAQQTLYECEIATEEATSKVEAVIEILKDKKREYENIKDEYNEKITGEEYKITRLEEQRDASIDSLNQEAQDLTAKTDKIKQNVYDLINKKRQLISQIDNNEITFPLSKHKETEVYAYVPFFLAMLTEKNANRIVVFSPARLIKDRSTTEKVSSFIAGKTPTLTERREETLSNFAHILYNLLQNNIRIWKEVSGRAEKLNLLRLPQTKQALLRGIEGLYSEGVLNNRVAQKLKNSLQTEFTTGASGRQYFCSTCGYSPANFDVEYCPLCGEKILGRTATSNSQSTNRTVKNNSEACTQRMYCKYCGIKNKSDAKFCKKCGQKMG